MSDGFNTLNEIIDKRIEVDHNMMEYDDVKVNKMSEKLRCDTKQNHSNATVLYRDNSFICGLCSTSFSKYDGYTLRQHLKICEGVVVVNSNRKSFGYEEKRSEELSCNNINKEE